MDKNDFERLALEIEASKKEDAIKENLMKHLKKNKTFVQKLYSDYMAAGQPPYTDFIAELSIKYLEDNRK
jgi:hypothetical protein